MSATWKGTFCYDQWPGVPLKFSEVFQVVCGISQVRRPTWTMSVPQQLIKDNLSYFAQRPWCYRTFSCSGGNITMSGTALHQICWREVVPLRSIRPRWDCDTCSLCAGHLMLTKRISVGFDVLENCVVCPLTPPPQIISHTVSALVLICLFTSRKNLPGSGILFHFVIIFFLTYYFKLTKDRQHIISQ